MYLSSRRFLVLAAILSTSIFFVACDNSGGPSGNGGLEFTFVGQDSIATMTGETATFRIAIKNNGRSVASVSCERVINELPDTSWNSTLCIGGRCFPPVVNAVSADLDPGATDKCEVDINAGTMPGTARVTVALYDLADPSKRYKRTFTCTSAP